MHLIEYATFSVLGSSFVILLCFYRRVNQRSKEKASTEIKDVSEDLSYFYLEREMLFVEMK